MPRRLITSLTVILAVATGSNASGQQLTLESLQSAPFVSELTVDATGRFAAWVEMVNGARNIWIATAPDFVGRQVTANTRDDGQEIGQLRWAADGRILAYVRGGGANSRGELPNPDHSPERAEQAVWVVDVASTATRRVAAGSQPVFSPAGVLAYVSGAEIWSATIGSSITTKRLAAIRGVPRELRWSPRGQQLAFISRRDDYGVLGVIDTASGELRYLDASTDMDGNPTWSPDGSRIAFIRVASITGWFALQPHPVAPEPWSIRIVDVMSGVARQVWKASAGVGSVFTHVGSVYNTPTLPPDLLWSADDHLVFPWEGDGWLHLYRVPVSGGTARLLTPGDGEVFSVALTLDGAGVVFSANTGDLERRRLWSVSLAGGAPVALTGNETIDTKGTPLADGRHIFMRSDARIPAHVAIRDADGRIRRANSTGLAASFPADRLVVPQHVSFRAPDGFEVPGQLFVPSDLRAGEKRPAVVWMHGGPWHQAVLGWHHYFYFQNTYALNQVLVSRGYIVLSVNFRSGTGYGLRFREGFNHGAAGGEEVQDVLAAGLYLRSRPDVDPSRIGAWGGSYGGYLTAAALAQASSLFVAGVDIHGVHDWTPVIRNFAPTYAPSEEVLRRNLASSPISRIKAWRSPVLLISGDDDRNVPFRQTLLLVEALRAQGVAHEVLVIPDEVHGFLRQQSWNRALAAAADFLDRHIRLRAGTN